LIRAPTSRRKAKKNSEIRRALEEAVAIEDGAIFEAAAVYDSSFERIIEELEQLPALANVPDEIFESFDTDGLAEILAKGLLASYLLGIYQVSLETGLETAAFAEGDEPIKLSFERSPDEAIEYFKSKKVVTRKTFDQLAEDARSAAFTVSGGYKKQIIEGFRSEIIKSLEAGTPQREVINRFREILNGANHKKLGAFHLETVIRSNLQLAYSTGRRRALERSADDLPYWQFQAVLDDRTRPEHRALHGIVLPANHEYWNTKFPPIGFNCRCTVTATTEIPEGYNPESPNGDAKIFYDDRGSPAKAEIDTSVYDLAAGDFKGVPPQGSLKEIIEGRVK
jgi:SPP1 gp7 family putative phage head morphogenesis protein